MPDVQPGDPAEEGGDARGPVEADRSGGYKQDRPDATSADAEENHLQGVTTMDIEKYRAAFEHWFEPSGRGLERDGGESYKFMTAYAAWSAWQAGWEARDRSSDPE